MRLYEFAGETLIAAEDDDDAARVIAEVDAEIDLDDPDAPLILIRASTSHERGILDDAATERAYQHLRETILR